MDDDGGQAFNIDDDARGDDAPVPSAAELRRMWADASETVKCLEKRGSKVSELVLEQARADRDGLEKRWRAAKPVHPLGKRLRWAASELEAALTKQDANRAELERFEDWVVQRRAELEARGEADVARTARKQKLLDELREESGHSPLLMDGSRIMERVRRLQPSIWATRTALRGINDDVGPAMESALEALPEGSKAWMDLHGALSSITNVQGILTDALDNDAEGAACYDMAAGEGSECADGDGDSLDDISLPEDANTGSAQGGGNGRARHYSPACGTGGKPRGDGSAAGGSRWAKPRRGGEGEWRRLNWADEQAAEAADGDIAAEAAARERQRAESAAKELAEQQVKIQEAAKRRAEEEAEERRRLEQALSPEEKAQAEALHAQQTAAAAAQFGTQQAADIAWQVHCQRVAEVVKGAREKDILVNQAELMQCTPSELEDWAQRHI